MPRLPTNFEKILSNAKGNSEEQNAFLEPAITRINYCVIIINAYNNYNCRMNSYYIYYISNKDLREECHKKNKFDVTGAATTSYLKIRL